jgi:hypothetical protein
VSQTVQAAGKLEKVLDAQQLKPKRWPHAVATAGWPGGTACQQELQKRGSSIAS